ncbi:unnamed protein product [marine sediment metagenome]|uniref:Serine-tRNA synthetase type1 N-terminal domain-containing protein n=1 Tax=marine sediment metagenome TaxID=412755 RepID=X1PZI0_9ZZZZ
MLSAKWVRDNLDAVKESLKKRGLQIDLDRFLSLDSQRRRLTQKFDELKRQQNVYSKKIGKLRQENRDPQEIIQKENTFQSPPKEWVNHRLENLHETLAKNTVASALALKEILAPIQLEPIPDTESDFYQIIDGEKKFKPYYIAHTKIQTLALLDDRYKGSNWLHWRRGWDSNPDGHRCLSPVFKTGSLPIRTPLLRASLSISLPAYRGARPRG